jgi:hypothetical protein
VIQGGDNDEYADESRLTMRRHTDQKNDEIVVRLLLLGCLVGSSREIQRFERYFRKKLTLFLLIVSLNVKILNFGFGQNPVVIILDKTTIPILG